MPTGYASALLRQQRSLATSPVNPQFLATPSPKPPTPSPTLPLPPSALFSCHQSCAGLPTPHNRRPQVSLAKNRYAATICLAATGRLGVQCVYEHFT